jgi:hypothetical protein
METKTVSDENLKDKGNRMEVTKLSQCLHFHHKQFVSVICLFGSLLVFSEAAATVPEVHTKHDKQQNTDTLIDKDSHTKFNDNDIQSIQQQIMLGSYSDSFGFRCSSTDKEETTATPSENGGYICRGKGKTDLFTLV